MRTIEEIRRANLQQLLQDGLIQADIARALNKNPKQVSQWFGKGTARAMSSATARLLEAAIKKPHGWLDNIHDLSIQAESIQHELENRDEGHGRIVKLDPAKIARATTVLLFLWHREAPGVAYDQAADPDLFALAYAYAVEITPENRVALETAVVDRTRSHRGDGEDERTVEDVGRAGAKTAG